MLKQIAERIADAYSGWHTLRLDGKTLAVFGITLLWLVMIRKNLSRTGRQLTDYALAAALACAFPVTAAILQIYQTQYYGYARVWVYVPVTALIAYGGVLGIERLGEMARRRAERGRAAWLAIAVCAVLFLCSGMGVDTWGHAQESSDLAAARTVMTQLREYTGQQADGAERTIVLWAPSEILRYARSLDGEVQLLYGRDMDDLTLSGFTYDIYGEELTEIYEWMDGIAPDIREETADYVERAFVLGANCVLLDDDITSAALEELRGNAQWEVTALIGYYLVTETD